jgi:hypothetical protein
MVRLSGTYIVKMVVRGKLRPILKKRIKGSRGKTYFFGFFRQFFKIPCMSFVITVMNNKTLTFTYANGLLAMKVTKHKRFLLGRIYFHKRHIGLCLLVPQE